MGGRKGSGYYPAVSLTPRAWRSFETSHRAVESKSAVEQAEFELLPRLQALDLSICEFGRFGRRSCLHEATQSLFLAMRTCVHVELAFALAVPRQGASLHCPTAARSLQAAGSHVRKTCKAGPDRGFELQDVWGNPALISILLNRLSYRSSSSARTFCLG